MTEARMICRNIGKTLEDAHYVILDAESFTGYGTIEYDFRRDTYTAMLNSPDNKKLILSRNVFASLDECLAWFKEGVNRDVYRHTNWIR